MWPWLVVECILGNTCLRYLTVSNASESIHLHRKCRYICGGKKYWKLDPLQFVIKQTSISVAVSKKHLASSDSVFSDSQIALLFFFKSNYILCNLFGLCKVSCLLELGDMVEINIKTLRGILFQNNEIVPPKCRIKEQMANGTKTNAMWAC